MSNSDLVDIDDVTFLFETKASYCVTKDDESFDGEVNKIFIPKSLVEKDGTTFTMPEWLAIDKGLV